MAAQVGSDLASTGATRPDPRLLPRGTEQTSSNSARTGWWRTRIVPPSSRRRRAGALRGVGLRIWRWRRAAQGPTAKLIPASTRRRQRWATWVSSGRGSVPLRRRSTFPAEVRLSTARPGGGATGDRARGADITERRDKEHEIRVRGTELGLMNERLLEANQALEQARRLQNDFSRISSMSLHALNAVIGFATPPEQDRRGRRGAADFRRSIREAAASPRRHQRPPRPCEGGGGRFELRLRGRRLTDDPGGGRRHRVHGLREGPGGPGRRPREPSAAVDTARFRQALQLRERGQITDKGGVVRARMDATSIVVSVEDTGAGIARAAGRALQQVRPGRSSPPPPARHRLDLGSAAHPWSA